MPLLELESVDLDTRAIAHGVVRVGARHRWVADPEGSLGSNDWWWISRTVLTIETSTVREVDELVRSRSEQSA